MQNINKEMVEAIKALTVKAEKSPSSSDAMRYSQAAQNIAHTWQVLDNVTGYPLETTYER